MWMWYFKIPYCIILILLVVMRDDTRIHDEVRWMVNDWGTGVALGYYGEGYWPGANIVWICWTKGWFIARHLKFMNCLWNFPFNIFGQQLTVGNKPHDAKLDKGGTTDCSPPHCGWRESARWIYKYLQMCSYFYWGIWDQTVVLFWNVQGQRVRVFLKHYVGIDSACMERIRRNIQTEKLLVIFHRSLFLFPAVFRPLSFLWWQK